MLRTLTIKNYKSILEHTIELGRINVFIGENGCGKTNILEALAMAAAALADKLSVEELFNRGMRVAPPSAMHSAFPGTTSEKILLRCRSDDRPEIELRIVARGQLPNDVTWVGEANEDEERLSRAGVADTLREISASLKQVEDKLKTQASDLTQLRQAAERLRALTRVMTARTAYRDLLGDFAIYNPNILALRGLEIMSRRAPLGIHGETLDSAVLTLRSDVWKDVLERAKCISWVDDIIVDPAGEQNYPGAKLGKSQSALYFFDKYMRPDDNVFSAENVNEGILHVLFYLTLFSGEGTPKVLGIDNIDTSLNPQLCRDLIKQLAELAKEHDKQALITTHNPAILDGLNLNDDEQRLFVVERTDEGPTVTERIKVKPRPEGQKLKLSELWMRGHLGGIPRSF